MFFVCFLGNESQITMGKTSLFLATIHDANVLSNVEILSHRRRKSGSSDSHTAPSKYSQNISIRRAAVSTISSNACSHASERVETFTSCISVLSIIKCNLYFCSGSRCSGRRKYRCSENTRKVASRTSRHCSEFTQYNARSGRNSCMVNALSNGARSRLDDRSFGLWWA